MAAQMGQLTEIHSIYKYEDNSLKKMCRMMLVFVWENIDI